MVSDSFSRGFLGSVSSVGFDKAPLLRRHEADGSISQLVMEPAARLNGGLRGAAPFAAEIDFKLGLCRSHSVPFRWLAGLGWIIHAALKSGVEGARLFSH
jgi:hypothetical protein